MSSKIGFIGAGNMCQALISGWLEKSSFTPDQIYATNRSPGKTKRLAEQFGIHAVATNEEIIDTCDVVILAVKPQDLTMAIEPIASSFQPSHTVVSLGGRLSFAITEKNSSAMQSHRARDAEHAGANSKRRPWLLPFEK